MEIKMTLATRPGPVKAYFSIVWEGKMTIADCKLVEGKNGLFAGMPQREFTDSGVKKYKNIVKLEKELQEKVNAAAVEAYRKLSGAPAEPEPDIPW